ncbi:MAG: hypothetical protein GTO51_03635 [Candidatus Latescibacteria bacterium]|nr:hypothetical protein [Candidatus Latescibacterota bacterium]NIM20931.1 hypothetical protein [Candidatus Latescibacterota bacterium]NIM65066.1 hypothetical protein [Candidatus Latescibacterota bacterium]NIO01581.1 hypothetical protein [Candidatus Latescibacterota bacterium]NIO28098.1 hypothetical protein [Candidatus Latescibacterota bacterium]
MDMEFELVEAIKRIQERDNRFHEDAYRHVLRSLEGIYVYTRQFRHVSAKELAAAVCLCARGMYGPMAFTFLGDWGIQSTDDIGAIVFHLIDEGILSKQEEERPEDFENLFGLKEVLEDPYFRNNLP